MWVIFKVLLNLLQYCFYLVFWPWDMWDLSFPTRDQTSTHWIGRWHLNHHQSPLKTLIFFTVLEASQVMTAHPPSTVSVLLLNLWELEYCLLHFLKESKTNNLSNGVLESESYQVLKKKLLLLLIEIASKGGIFFFFQIFYRDHMEMVRKQW